MMHTTTLDALGALFAATAAERRAQIIALCADLVAARSVNPPGDTRDAAGVVCDALAGLGIPCRQEFRDERMPSVVAHVDSGRPGRHLVLNVHLDTMPAGDEEAWSVPPYRLTRQDGRLYGLGIGNMKGAAAAMVHAVAMLDDNRDAWNGRITFTAVSDEVVFGDNGAAHLLDVLPGMPGDAMLCGEGPGFRRLAIAEKGVLWLRLTATGDRGHSSAVVRGRSATARIAAAVSRIDGLTGIRARVPEALAGLFPDDDPGFALTANVGVIAAGTFIGQVAAGGTAEVDLRVPPGFTCDDAQARVAAIADEVGGIEVERIKGWDPNWTDPDSELVQAWQAAQRGVDGDDAGVQPAVRLPASDASRWRTRGIPAICYGPQATESAGIDEYADEGEVIRCAALYATSAAGFLR